MMTAPLRAIHCSFHRSAASLIALAAALPVAGAQTPFELLDNGGFNEPLPAFRDGRGVVRIPWWRTTRGADQLAEVDGSIALRTAPGEVAQQPVAAFAALSGDVYLSGKVRGRGSVTLIDGAEGRASIAVGVPDEFAEFGLEVAQFESALGRPPIPRFTFELRAAGDEDVEWRDLSVVVPLPLVDEAELRTAILAELDWIFALWVERGRDDAGPEKTGFLASAFDVVTGERLFPIDGAPNVLFELLLDAAPIADRPEWTNALERFLDDFLRLGLNETTGLPQVVDAVSDQPKPDQFVEVASFLGFLLDVAERGPERFREGSLAAAKRMGEAVLEHGVLPDGSVAPKYRPRDGAPDTNVSYLRRLDLVAKLARLGAATGDDRYLDVAREAVATFEFTHFWPGSWFEVDPGFDDNYGNYGARAVELWRAYPNEPTFRRIAWGGFQHYAPLWRDAVRLGGNVAADQVRCWRIAVDLCALEPESRPEIAELLWTAARGHFKGEQYGNGAWGDVTVFDFDPKDQLQVGDLTGTPQNLLYGLASLYDAELFGASAEERLPLLRAMFSAVLSSSRDAYRRPYGYLSSRTESQGTNLSQGSLRLAVGLVEMLSRLGQ